MGLGDAAIINGIIAMCGGRPMDFQPPPARRGFATPCNCGADESKGRFHVSDCPAFARSPASQALFDRNERRCSNSVHGCENEVTEENIVVGLTDNLRYCSTRCAEERRTADRLDSVEL